MSVAQRRHGGGLAGWITLSRLGRLQRELGRLEHRLRGLERAGGADPNRAATVTRTPQEAVITPSPAPVEPLQGESDSRPAPPPRRQGPRARSAAPTAALWHGPLRQAREHWMVWLGGLCVALAGVFTVRYSIDAGLLRPTARVVLAVVIGLALHLLAEWLRRRTGAPHPAFAALAGAASITLYAAMLAALHLYQLLDARLVFALLALISLATMALALYHGPALAIAGLLADFARQP